MSEIEFVLNRQGVEELLHSEGVKNLMREKAKEVLDRCPDIGFGMHVAVTSEGRAQATVGTRSVYSERHNNKHRTLQKALGGGG